MSTEHSLVQLLAAAEKAWWDRLHEVMESEDGTPTERIARIPNFYEFTAEQLSAHRLKIVRALYPNMYELFTDLGCVKYSSNTFDTIWWIPGDL